MRLLFFVALAAVAIGSVLTNANPIGFRVDWNIPFQPQAISDLYLGTDGFTAWNYANGGTTLFYPTLAPYLLLVSLLGKALLSAGVIERVLIIGALAGAGEGMFRLTAVLLPRASKVACAVAAVSYVLGTFIFTKLAQGVLQEAVSYALMPFVLLAFYYACAARTRIAGAAFAALTGVLIAGCAVQTQYGLLALAVIFAYAVWQRRLLVLAVGCIAAGLVSAYAAVPLAFSLHTATSQFQLQTPLEELTKWAPTFEQAVRQAGYVGQFAESATTLTGTFALWANCGYALFAMALAGFILTRKSSGYVLALILAMLVVCASLPKLDAAAFEFVLRHAPLMFMFRESYRFEALVAFIQSIGLAYFAESICRLEGRKALGWMGAVTVLIFTTAFSSAAFMPAVAITGAVAGGAYFLTSNRVRTANFQRAASIALLFVVVAGSTPFIGAGFASQTQTFAPPQSAYQTYSWLARSKSDARVLYVPFLIPMHPRGALFSGVDPTVSWSPLPSIGNYVPLRIGKQFASAFYSGDLEQARMLDDWLGFKYLDYRNWIQGDFYASTPAARTGRFTSESYSDRRAVESAIQNGYHRVQHVTSDSNEDLYQRAGPPLNYAAALDRVSVVDGDLTTAEEGYRPGDVAVFANQNSGGALSDVIRAGAPVKISQGVPYGLILSFVNANRIQDAGINATGLDADHDWSAQGAWNSWWWLNHDYMAATEDVALVARVNAHVLSFPGLRTAGRAVILVKYFQGPNSTSLHVHFGGRHWVIQAYAPQSQAGYRWFTEPVIAKLSDVLSVANAADGDGVVARAALVPVQEFNSAARHVRLLLAHAPVQYVLRSSTDLSIEQTGTYIAEATCAAPRAMLDGTYVTFAKWKATYVAHLRMSIGRHTWRALNRGCAVVLENYAPLPRTSPIKALQRTGQASYAVQPGATSFIVLSTGFSPLWTLGGGESTHLLVNGYANGWLYAPKEFGRRVEIHCRSVFLLRLGLLISALALLATAALLFSVCYRNVVYAKGEHLHPE